MKAIIFILTCLIMTFNSNAQTTKIIAHRGAWKNTNAPQNSIAALEEAIKGKYWGSEFDVCLTKDDVLIVNHDNDFKGIDIATSESKDLLNQRLSNGEKIPTAKEYMLAGSNHPIKMIYEIKPNKLGKERTIKSTELSYKLVKNLKALQQTIFISFSYDACLKLREMDTNVQIQYLGNDKSPKQLHIDKITGLDFNIGVYKNHPDYIKEAKKYNMQTNVWTVNDAETMRHFIEQNIDFITTDEPELLKQLLK